MRKKDESEIKKKTGLKLFFESDVIKKTINSNIYSELLY